MREVRFDCKYDTLYSIDDVVVASQPGDILVCYAESSFSDGSIVDDRMLTKDPEVVFSCVRNIITGREFDEIEAHVYENNKLVINYSLNDLFGYVDIHGINSENAQKLIELIKNTERLNI